MNDLWATESRWVLGVGIAVLDVVLEVAEYPPEDAEVRALAQRRCVGGNTANTLKLLRQFGHGCSWCGTFADDETGAEILSALSARGIDTASAVCRAGSCTPTSYIATSRKSGSRTILHYRDLPELRAADFSRVRLDGFDWVHFEGRNPEETAVMLRDCVVRRPELPISLEIEKPRPRIELLLEGPRVLIYSRAYVESCGCDDPESFLANQWERTTAEILFLPWGAKGAYGQARGGPVCFAPAHAPAPVLETVGAGDVFNAAVIHGMLDGRGLRQVLERANRLAGHKCGRRGLDGVISSAAALELL